MKQALAAAAKAKSLLANLGFSFGAPEGYFCETLKTEEHMGKVQKKVQEEQDAQKASADARKQRQLKKFGKKVQTETLAKRAAQKKEDLAKIAQLRKSIQSSTFSNIHHVIFLRIIERKLADANDDFDVEADGNDEGAVEKRKIIRGGKKVLVDKSVSAKRSYKV